ncbi:MAG: hypothetical protein COT24_01365 [Candidatus Kerfeldbacteria bacterium CG08_land_8_20_14_0_20_40_16]|uniref:Uncharacterized protein n=1 Tax=Candidatus Kerfeldbacteria bacterium CG08_land_8_20_14_0_20_40_16 TaxID=2014244 RepID=A0A2H0YYP5_9BACT|nr:MAG: hypothetical protein COT24_01365 [Candidatus Kerfeldbacteria bacterium CG08_land_8_20_14_0_20_40_16]
MDNAFVNALKYVFIELIGKIFYFPIWWYTTGTKKVLLFISRQISALSETLSIKILFKNLFKPMYGDYSRSGRIISFFVRIFHFFFLLLVTVIWILVLIILLLIWLVLPIFIIYSIIFQLTEIKEHYLITIIHGIL